MKAKLLSQLKFRLTGPPLLLTELCFSAKKRKEKGETSLLLIEENAESAPLLPGEDSSTDLWGCTGPPGAGTGLQITFLIHLWESLFYKSSLRAAETLALSSFVIQTDRTGSLLPNTVKHRGIKDDFTYRVFLYSSTLWNSSLSFRVRQGLGAYPSMHWVKASEIPWTECLSITMCTKKQTNNSVPWGLLQS